MAYVKTVWETGDTITAAKLNNAEDGIESAYPVIIRGEYTEISGDTVVVLSSTFTEIKAVLDRGICPIIIIDGGEYPDDYYTIVKAGFGEGKYIDVTRSVDSFLHFTDEESNDTPVASLM